jgi:hypothetical protein
MSISNYSELQTVVSDWTYRNDQAARIPNYIVLAESDMQVRCKLVEYEGSATVPVVAGVGALPTGFTGMRSIYWNGNMDLSLRYLTPAQMDARRDVSGDPTYYTITGTNLEVSPAGDGDAVIRYKARFTPLSDANTTNVILSNYPDAYLHGALLQFAIWAQDDARAVKEEALFNAAVERIVKDNNQKKYAGTTLAVRPA